MVWFGPAREAAKKGEVFSVPAYKDTRYPIIHRDDLADLYVRVAERVSSWRSNYLLMHADKHAGADARWAGVHRV